MAVSSVVSPKFTAGLLPPCPRSRAGFSAWRWEVGRSRRWGVWRGGGTPAGSRPAEAAARGQTRWPLARLGAVSSRVRAAPAAGSRPRAGGAGARARAACAAGWRRPRGLAAGRPGRSCSSRCCWDRLCPPGARPRPDSACTRPTSTWPRRRAFGPPPPAGSARPAARGPGPSSTASWWGVPPPPAAATPSR